MTDHGEGPFGIQAPIKEVLPHKYPPVTFQLNQDLDVKVGAAFLGYKIAGMDAGAGILSVHPGLSNAATHNEPLRENAVEDYVQQYYKSHSNELVEVIPRFERDWNSVESHYFEFVDTIFKGHQWPSGAYVGFLSIFNTGPRFLDTKTFQLDYKSNASDLVNRTAHEMMHFIFFDWLENREAAFAQVLGYEKAQELSEIFNDIAMRQPRYKKVESQELPLAYIELEPVIKQIEAGLKGKEFTISTFIAEAKKFF